jgi:hypothetical protein
VLLSIKVRPESFPTASPMSAWLGFLQYLGYLFQIHRLEASNPLCFCFCKELN